MRRFLTSSVLMVIVSASAVCIALSGCGGRGDTDIKPEELDPNFGAVIQQSGARAAMEEERRLEEQQLQQQQAE